MGNYASDLQYPPPPKKKKKNTKQKNPHGGKVVSDIMAPRFLKSPWLGGWVNLSGLLYSFNASCVVTGDFF